MTARRFDSARFTLTASIALLVLTTGVEAARQQDDGSSARQPTAPNPAVVRELDRLFRESGQEMPSMRRQDLPYAQSLQTDRIRPQVNSGRGIRTQTPSQPGLLGRFLGRFKRKPSAAPQSAAEQSIPSAPAGRPMSTSTSTNGLRAVPRQQQQVPTNLERRQASQSRPPAPPNPVMQNSPPVVSATRSASTAPSASGRSKVTDASTSRGTRQPMATYSVSNPTAESRRPMSIQPRETIPTDQPGRATRNSVRISEGKPRPRRVSRNDEFVSPFDEPESPDFDLQTAIDESVVIPPTPAPPMIDSAVAGAPNRSATIPSPPVVDAERDSVNDIAAKESNPFRSVEINTAQEAFRSVGQPAAGMASAELQAPDAQSSQHVDSRDRPEGWKRTKTPVHRISESTPVQNHAPRRETQDLATETADSVQPENALSEEVVARRSSASANSDGVDATDVADTAAAPNPDADAATEPESRSPRERLRAAILSRSGESGFRGFCPVALRDQRDLIDASPEFAAPFGLQTYNFCSAAARQTFLANPTRYAPAAGGCDVVMLVNSGEEEQGSIEFAAWFRDRLYLFTSRETMTMFLRNSSTFADRY